jgi:tRNA pseudouridine38-40 synthase
MPRFAFAIEFDGRDFQGTQLQPGLRTLQEVIGGALAAISGTKVPVRLSSRLDADVSALLLPGDVHLEREWQPRILGMALATKLPRDVVARRVAVVADSWNAKRDAIEKTYLYRVLVRGVRPVIDTHALWVRQLDHPERFHDLARLLVGRRDLSGFACQRGDGSDHADPSRLYRSASWTSTPCGDDLLWCFRITGSGFLYKQIRGLVGAMIHVAQGRASMDDFISCIETGWGARRFANMAPGHGLMLEQVRYEPEPAWVVM